MRRVIDCVLPSGRGEQEQRSVGAGPGELRAHRALVGDQFHPTHPPQNWQRGLQPGLPPGWRWAPAAPGCCPLPAGVPSPMLSPARLPHRPAARGSRCQALGSFKGRLVQCHQPRNESAGLVGRVINGARPWRNFASMSGMAWVRRSGSSRVSSGWALQRSKGTSARYPEGSSCCPSALTCARATTSAQGPAAKSRISAGTLPYVVQLANIGRHTFSQHGPLLSPLTCLLLCHFLGLLALLLGVPCGSTVPAERSRTAWSL